MQTKSVVAAAAMMLSAIGGLAQTGTEPAFQKWALTPPMGWNSWDCYGPTVVESEVKANADYMATNLLDHGWEYVVVDIRWYVENDKAGGYNQTNPIYVIDEFGRYTPALNRFPSAADGVGFKALADYVHARGLKFGIHLMRGIPKEAVAAKLPVRGTDGITCDMIANNDSTCTWLRDNWKVDWRKPGAQQYYNSCFEMYADWGVDFVKIDDLARPYHTAEIEMIRNAIDNCGRPMVLSISPGETPVEQVELLRKFHDGALPSSPENSQTVKDAICLASLENGTLYGKTGTSSTDGKNTLGWFIGYIESEDNVCYFAANIQNEDNAGGSAAAEITLAILSDLGFRVP